MFEKVKSFFSRVKDKVNSIKTKVPDSVKRNPNVEFDFTEEVKNVQK